MELARVGKNCKLVAVLLGIAEIVASHRFLSECVEPHALHPTGSAGETAVDDFVLEAESLKNLRALVALQRADADLGHHLEHALGDRLAVLGDQFVILLGHRVDRLALSRTIDRGVLLALACFLLGNVFFSNVEQSFATSVPESFKSKIRIDRVRTVADQQAVLMHLTGFATFDQDADACPLGLLHQVMMHGSGGQQRAERHAVVLDFTIREDDQREALVNGLLRLGADTVERLLHPELALDPRPSDINRLRTPAAAGFRVGLHMLERGQLFVGENRVRQAQSAGVLFGGFQQVLLGADEALQRHNDLFANRVDRWVGDLRKELLEVVVQHSRLVAEYR